MYVQLRVLARIIIFFSRSGSTMGSSSEFVGEMAFGTGQAIIPGGKRVHSHISSSLQWKNIRPSCRCGNSQSTVNLESMLHIPGQSKS